MGFQKQTGSNANNVSRNISSLELNPSDAVVYDRVANIVVEATSASVPKDVAGTVVIPTTTSDLRVTVQPIDYNDEYVVNSLNVSNISHNYQRMAFSDKGTVNNSGTDTEVNGVFMQTDVIGQPGDRKIKGIFVRPYEPNSMAVRTLSETTDINGGDGLIVATAAITLTLPTAVGIAGKVFTVKRNTSAGDVTITPTGSETIDGDTSFALTTDGESFGFVSDGSNYHIIN